MSTVLSVITVTHQRVSLLLRKAASLAAQTLDPTLFEWCVVSNGDQEAADALAGLEAPFAVKPLVLERNQPVAAARNAAAAMASGELLLLSDDDVILPPGCLAAHLEAHREAQPVANAGAGTEQNPGAHVTPGQTGATTAPLGLGVRPQGSVPGRSLPGRPRVVIGDLRLPRDLRLAAGGSDEREPFERVASAAGRALWINATGANTSLPRAAFEAVGGYDTAFAGYGGEDSDLALRLKRHGAVFVRSAAAWAEHVGLVSGDHDKAFAAGRAGVRVWRKHGGLEAALLLGVHPALLTLKRAALATPLKRLWGSRTAAYERAYLRGAAVELRAAAAGKKPSQDRADAKGSRDRADTRRSHDRADANRSRDRADAQGESQGEG